MFDRRSFLKFTGLGAFLGLFGWKCDDDKTVRGARPSDADAIFVDHWADRCESSYIGRGALYFVDPAKAATTVGIEVPDGSVGILFDDFRMTVRHSRGGRARSGGTFGRLVAPKWLMEHFYWRYGDILNARTNTLVLGLFSPDDGEIDSWLPVLGVVLTQVGKSVVASDMCVVDDVHFIAVGSPVMLKRQDDGQLVYTLDDPRWLRDEHEKATPRRDG